MLNYMKKILLMVFALLLLPGCSFQKQLKYPERWMYVMCIRHESNDIAVSCINSSNKILSTLSPKKQAQMSEFKNFSIFGKRGTVDTDCSFFPQVTDKLNYIINEVVLSDGESIVDFNGFSISAGKDYLLVSNNKKKYRIKAKHDWTDITSKGAIYYCGSRGARYVSDWHMFLWSIGLRESIWDDVDEKEIKEYRFFKWCVSPIEGKPNEFRVTTRYMPHPPELLCITWKTWYSSTWK